ncbi:MAG: hypothetical protein KDA41_03660, partial [Planctomycetales bacterium]|nr:hypothetical protein [Planctomycetales bacterium]
SLGDITGPSGGLFYNAAQFDLLKQIHDAGTGSIEIGDLTWEFAAGLGGTAGLSGSGGDFSLVLNAAGGTGLVGSSAEVPEPASIAVWSALGIVLAGFGFYRTRRKQ